MLVVLIGLLALARRAEALTTDALLDTLQHTGFNYFWNQANPTNGLVRDRSQSGSVCSIASTGFGLSSICIAIDHGWITREAGRTRVLTTLNTFWNGPQGPGDTGTIGYKGLYYHWLDMFTATRTWDSELSTIDTALLFAGILDAKQYFSGADPEEIQVQALADSIYRRADWEFVRNGQPRIMMGWKPTTGFQSFGQWTGYNEAMILYILALGSPTHPVPASTWSSWTSTYSYATAYGWSYIIFAPLFGHQYSHCWIDFRGRTDAFLGARGITYFENSRRATLANHMYCFLNPNHWAAYSDTLWGLTASDDPLVGYQAHGAPPQQNDNGTITPTAAASSIAFAPEIVIPTLHNMYNNWPSLWSAYGFKDAFCPRLNWYGADVLGIDQGPIVMMIENYRTNRVWDRFMRNPEIQLGLVRAGFVPFSDAVPEPPGSVNALQLSSAPNPTHGSATVRFRIADPGPVRLGAFDIMGREVARLVDADLAAGEHTVVFHNDRLAAGVYLLRLEHGGRAVLNRTVRLP